jgi:hypothetical protein
MESALTSLRVDAWAVDPLTGSRLDWTEGRNVRILRARLTDVRSVERPGAKLGDLLFAESFVGSPTNVPSEKSETPAIDFKSSRNSSESSDNNQDGSVRSGRPFAGERSDGCLVLTDGLPAFATWLGAGSEEEGFRSQKEDLERIMAAAAPPGDGFPTAGTPLSGMPRGSGTPRASISRHGLVGAPLQELAEDARVVLECELAPSVPGKWYAFDSGLVFESARLGQFTLDFTGGVISSAHVHRSGTDHSPEALVFHCEVKSCPLNSYGPYSHLSLCGRGSAKRSIGVKGVPVSSEDANGTDGTETGGGLIAVTFDLLALTPTARKQFAREILPVWESVWERNGIRFGNGMELPLPALLVGEAQDRDAGFGASAQGFGKGLSEEGSGCPKTFPVAVTDLSVSRYLYGLELQDAGKRCRELGVNRLPEVAEPQRESSAGPIYITVVTGVPGGGKHLLVDDLVRTNGERRWHVIDTSVSASGLSSPLSVDGVKLEQELSRVHEAVRAPKQPVVSNGEPRKSPRLTFVGVPDHVLVISPGLVPVSRVMEVVRLSEAVQCGRFEVASVTACVEAKLFFEDAPRWKVAPGVIEQVGSKPQTLNPECYTEPVREDKFLLRCLCRLSGLSA